MATTPVDRPDTSVSDHLNTLPIPVFPFKGGVIADLITKTNLHRFLGVSYYGDDYILLVFDHDDAGLIVVPCSYDEWGED